MRFVKLEGDGERFVDGPVLLFRLRQPAAGHGARDDVPLRRVRGDPTLDVQFVTRHESFMIEDDDDREDLAGPDVILVHRLLKSSVGGAGGPAAYAFFSEPCQLRLPEDQPATALGAMATAPFRCSARAPSSRPRRGRGSPR